VDAVGAFYSLRGGKKGSRKVGMGKEKCLAGFLFPSLGL